MKPRLLWLAALLLLSCETEDEYPDCTQAIDPIPGARRNTCPKSAVSIPLDANWRDVSGLAWQSDSGLPGAIIHVTPLADGTSASIGSGANGFFGPIRNVAIHFDLTAKIAGDVVAFRGLTTRYVQPSLEREPRSLGLGWSKALAIRIDSVVPEGHSLAFFANGGNVYGITGDLERGFTLLDRDFTGPATVHVVEYETGKELTTATAYGKAELQTTVGAPHFAAIRLEPITRFEDVTFDVAAPAGLAAKKLDVFVGYSRSSLSPLTTASVGETKRLPVIPGFLFYATRVQATASDGSSTESGERGFDVFAKRTTVELVTPPTLIAPALDNERLDLGYSFAATGAGVLEHAFEEVAEPHRLIRIVTTTREVRLPDATVLGDATPHGPYRWTVRSYPKARFADEITGIDGRRYHTTGTSVPRTVIFP